MDGRVPVDSGAIFGRYGGLIRGPFFAVGLVALTALLGACSAAESLNPAGWFSSPDEGKEAAEEPTAGEPTRAPAPDWDKLRAGMADGLIADRENARHTDRPIPRQSEQLAAPPEGSR